MGQIGEPRRIVQVPEEQPMSWPEPVTTPDPVTVPAEQPEMVPA
jgi:hypothetical protein